MVSHLLEQLYKVAYFASDRIGLTMMGNIFTTEVTLVWSFGMGVLFSISPSTTVKNSPYMSVILVTKYAIPAKFIFCTVSLTTPIDATLGNFLVETVQGTTLFAEQRTASINKPQTRLYAHTETNKEHTTHK